MTSAPNGAAHAYQLVRAKITRRVRKDYPTVGDPENVVADAWETFATKWTPEGNAEALLWKIAKSRALNVTTTSRRRATIIAAADPSLEARSARGPRPRRRREATPAVAIDEKLRRMLQEIQTECSMLLTFGAKGTRISVAHATAVQRAYEALRGGSFGDAEWRALALLLYVAIGVVPKSQTPKDLRERIALYCTNPLPRPYEKVTDDDLKKLIETASTGGAGGRGNRGRRSIEHAVADMISTVRERHGLRRMKSVMLGLPKSRANSGG